MVGGWFFLLFGFYFSLRQVTPRPDKRDLILVSLSVINYLAGANPAVRPSA